MEKLDTVYKNLFNERFSISVGIMNKGITVSNRQVSIVRKIQRSIPKLVKTNIENIWTNRSVET